MRKTQGTSQPVNKTTIPDAPKRAATHSFRKSGKLYHYVPYFIDGDLGLTVKVGNLKVPDFALQEAILLGPISANDRVDYGTEFGYSIQAKIGVIGNAMSIVEDALFAYRRYQEIYQEFIALEGASNMLFNDYVAAKYPGVQQAMDLYDPETHLVSIPNLRTQTYTVVNIELEIIKIVTWLGSRIGRIVGVVPEKYALSKNRKDSYVVEPVSVEYLLDKIVDMEHLYSPSKPEAETQLGKPRWMEFLEICHLWNNDIEEKRVEESEEEANVAPPEETDIPLA